MALVDDAGSTRSGNTITPPRGGFRAVSRSHDRKATFPDWPAWALLMLRSAQDISGFVFWNMVFVDSPEIREALDRAPRDYILFGGNLIIVVSAGAPFDIWESALSGFNPINVPEPAETAAGSELDGLTAQELLDNLRRAERDSLRRQQLDRLKAFSTMGGVRIFPFIDPAAAEVAFTDPFPNLQAR